MLTPAAKAAKHRRAKDKRQRKTLCWRTANGKECFNGERCTFKQVVPEVKGQTVSRTSASRPNPATEHDGNRTKVSLPCPAASQVVSRETESVLCPSATPEFQGSAAPVLCSSEEPELEKGSARDDWIKCCDECFNRDSSADRVCNHSHCGGGADAPNKYHTGNSWRSRHWKMDSWSSSHWETSGWHQEDGNHHDCDDTWSKHNIDDGWNSSHWETSGWCQEDEFHHNFRHAFFEALNVDQLINSLHRGDESVTTFTGLEVDPGESLADTAAQSGIIDLRLIRKAEEALFYKFGLKPRVTHSNNQAVGIGSKAKVLGTVEMPSGMGDVNGCGEVHWLVAHGVLPLTPVSLLKPAGAVIDLNNDTMELKKIETTSSLRDLPSGHVAHKLTEFAPGGWQAPTPEQTKLFQARSGDFRPVSLPGESRQRRQHQTADFSSGLAYTASDHPHLSLCHNKCV